MLASTRRNLYNLVWFWLRKISVPRSWGAAISWLEARGSLAGGATALWWLVAEVVTCSSRSCLSELLVGGEVMEAWSLDAAAAAELSAERRSGLSGGQGC